MAENELEQMLRQAQEQGRLHSQGSFSLDAVAASRQFGQYALQEPLAIVARLIRVGSLCGPVNLEMSARATSLALSGSWSAVNSLAQSFDQVLSNDPAEREFSVAINSIVARPFQSLRILRGEPGRVAQLTMDQDRQVEVVEAVNLAQELTFTRVDWTTPKSRRSLAQEIGQLRRWFRYCRVAVTINGEILSLPLGRARGPGLLKHLGAAKQVLLKGPWYLPASYFWADHQILEFRLYSPQPARNEVGLTSPSLASAQIWAGLHPPTNPDHCCLALAFASDLSQPGRIDWVHRGQLLDSEPAQFSLPGVTAVVACHGLTLDLLGEKLVQNQALDARRQFLRDWISVLQDELSSHYPDAGSELMLRVLFDSRWRRQPVRLPVQGRVQELLRRLSPANQTA